MRNETGAGPALVSNGEVAAASISRSATALNSSVSAVLHDQPELVAGVAGEKIALAAVGPQQLGEAGDHLVGDIVAIGAVEHEQIVDADQQSAEGLLVLGRGGEEMAGLLQQARAVQRAGQQVEAGGERELPLFLVTVGDDADQTVSARRAAVRPGEPASGVLDPDGRVAGTVRRNDAIADLEWDALALIDGGRARDRLVRRVFAVVGQAFGIAAAGRESVDVRGSRTKIRRSGPM